MLIEDKRKLRLLALFNETDFQNNPQAEINALEWLVNAQAMDRKEADIRIAKIRNDADDRIEPSGDPELSKLH